MFLRSVLAYLCTRRGFKDKDGKDSAWTSVSSGSDFVAGNLWEHKYKIFFGEE